jgi:hypothetical protein
VCDLPKAKVMKLAEIAKVVLFVPVGSVQKRPVTIWISVMLKRYQ